VRPGDPVGDGGGVVAAPVVDDDNLYHLIAVGCPGDQIVKATDDSSSLVVRW
jgi:hypothetical protein